MVSATGTQTRPPALPAGQVKTKVWTFSTGCWYPRWEKQSAVSEEVEPEALLGARNSGRNHGQTEVFFCSVNLPEQLARLLTRVLTRVLTDANVNVGSPGATNQ